MKRRNFLKSILGLAAITALPKALAINPEPAKMPMFTDVFTDTGDTPITANWEEFDSLSVAVDNANSGDTIYGRASGKWQICRHET